MQQTDVKTKNLTATGASSVGRCRIKSVYIVSAGTAGSVSLKDGGSTGTELIKLDTPALVTAYNVMFPGEGVLFQGDPYLTLTTATSITFAYA